MTEQVENMPANIRQSVTIEKDLYDWVQTQIKEKRFKDLTHAVNFSLYVVKQESERKG